MGLDISFNMEQAINAGLQILRTTNGTEEEVIDAQTDGDTDRANWLSQDKLVGSIDGFSLTNFSVDEGLDINDNPILFVRANKWGSLYEPLTTFLSFNDITWGEA